MGVKCTVFKCLSLAEKDESRIVIAMLERCFYRFAAVTSCSYREHCYSVRQMIIHAKHFLLGS